MLWICELLGSVGKVGLVLVEIFVCNDLVLDDELNNIDPTIKIKIEWKQDGKIPFLDVMVSRDPGHLSFTIYRKPTYTEFYLQFFSTWSFCKYVGSYVHVFKSFACLWSHNSRWWM